MRRGGYTLAFGRCIVAKPEARIRRGHVSKPMDSTRTRCLAMAGCGSLGQAKLVGRNGAGIKPGHRMIKYGA